jgi:hypothetical protein
VAAAAPDARKMTVANPTKGTILFMNARSPRVRIQVS